MDVSFDVKSFLKLVYPTRVVKKDGHGLILADGVVAESLCLKKILDFWLPPLLNQVLGKEESKYIFIKFLYKREYFNIQVLRGQRSPTI